MTVKEILLGYASSPDGDPFNKRPKLTLDEAVSQINQLIQERVFAAKVNHLTDLSRAVGILDGIKFPDRYLSNQHQKLLKELSKEKSE